MNQPSDDDLRQWAKTLDSTKWRRLAEAIIEYRRGEIPTINSSVFNNAAALIARDGFPSGGLSDGGGGGLTIKVRDEETGDMVRIPVTGVEAAAFELVDTAAAGRIVDTFHDCVENAVAYFQQALLSRNAAENRVRLIDGLTPDHPKTRSICDDCGRAGLRDPHVNAPEHFGNAGGILDRNADLCRMHYDFVLTRKRRANPDETQHKDRTGRWPAQRVDPKTKNPAA